MKTQSPNPDPSWEMLRKAWVSTSAATHPRLESTQRMQSLWAAEARRLWWVTLGDWMLALAMAGILSAMALQVTEGQADSFSDSRPWDVWPTRPGPIDDVRRSGGPPPTPQKRTGPCGPNGPDRR